MLFRLFERGNIGTLIRTAAWFLLDQRTKISNGFSSSDTFLTKIFIPVFPDGRRFLSRLRTVRVIFCCSRDDADNIFKNKELYSAAEGYRPLQSVLGIHSVFVQEGEAHKKIREEIHKILNNFENDAGRQFNVERYVSSHMKSGKIRFFEICQQITSEYLFDNMFSRSDNKTRNYYRDVCLKISREVTGTAVFLLRSSRAYTKTPLRALFENIRVIRSARLDLRSFIDGYIRANIELISTTLGRKLTVEDVRQLVDNYLTFVVAGFESTATSVAWTAYELAREPDLQDRLRSEIISAPDGESEGLKQIIKESLRLHPPIPFFVRRILKEHLLSNGEQVRRGDLLIFSIEEANLRAFSEGDKFLPFREDGGLRSFTFGGGQRTCPGRVLAFKEIQIIISTIISRYRLRLDPSAPSEVKMNNSVTATPRFGMPLIAEPVGS